jgi:6-phosphogluconolactonase
MKVHVTIALIGLLFWQSISAQKNPYLIIGTYTTGKSEGIYVYDFNTSTGSCSYANKAKASSPSFLTVSKNQNFVYAVQQPADSTRLFINGTVAAYAFNKTNGALQLLNTQSTNGTGPCHISIDQTGKWLAAANYASGNFSVLPIKPDGTIDAATQTIQHEGKGPNEKRQAGPHAHACFFTPNNSALAVTDLGIDKTIMYNFDAASGMVEAIAQPYIDALPGSGPRHLDFHPSQKKKIIYVLEELTNTISVVKQNNGTFNSIQTISSVPADYTGGAGAADVHVSADGKFVYVSNRGSSNTIGIFSVDNNSGKLTLVGHQSTLGKTPRNFTLDPTGNFLLVANQDSNNIVVFSRDAKTGLLKETGYQIIVPNPVCLKWITP